MHVQENNFKAVLECIRDLMNERTVLPEWLHDIFLGYGDPAAAQYTNLPNTLRTVDFKVAPCSVQLTLYGACKCIPLRWKFLYMQVEWPRIVLPAKTCRGI